MDKEDEDALVSFYNSEENKLRDIFNEKTLQSRR